jgi:hypothetical protein
MVDNDSGDNSHLYRSSGPQTYLLLGAQLAQEPQEPERRGSFIQFGETRRSPLIFPTKRIEHIMKALSLTQDEGLTYGSSADRTGDAARARTRRDVYEGIFFVRSIRDLNAGVNVVSVRTNV